MKSNPVAFAKDALYWAQYEAARHWMGCRKCQQHRPCARYHNLAWKAERLAGELGALVGA
jgi:hypothetical protein